MTSIYEKATRIELGININAPVIIVPSNSSSYNAILLNMGRITIQNRFKDLLEVVNEQGHHVVLDEMKMRLTNFSLERVLLDQNYYTINFTNLLKKLTFDISVTRNITSNWYKAIPEVDVFGHISKIEVIPGYIIKL